MLGVRWLGSLPHLTMPPASSILPPPPAMGPRPCSTEQANPAQGPEDEGEDLFSVAPATYPRPGGCEHSAREPAGVLGEFSATGGPEASGPVGVTADPVGGSKIEAAKGAAATPRPVTGKLTRAQGKRDAEWLAANNFMGRAQTAIVLRCLRDEEWSFFAEVMRDLRARIEGMPATYETEKRGMEPTVFLHYFGGTCDLYITEKDKGDPEDAKNGIPAQSQAFGLADLFGDGGEVGYISLPEALGTGRIELDFHFQPIALKTLQEQRR